MQFRIDGERLREDLEGVVRAAETALGEAANQTAHFIAFWARQTDKFTDRTGAARRSIRVVTRTPFDHEVVAGGAPAPYVRFLEVGTKEHTIAAVNAKALRFVVNGQVVFRQSVHHPGTEPLRFMEDAAAEGEEASIRFVEASLARALRS